MYNGEYPDGNVLDTLSGVLCGAVSFRVAEGAAGWVTLQFCAAVGGMDSVGGGNNCDIPRTQSGEVFLPYSIIKLL